MLATPRSRLFAATVALVALGGLFVVGGTDWTLAASVDAVPGEAASLEGESGERAEVVGGEGPLTAGFGVTELLATVDERTAGLEFWGVPYKYAVSAFAVGFVGLRAVLGWRVDRRTATIEPRTTGSGLSDRLRGRTTRRSSVPAERAR